MIDCSMTFARYDDPDGEFHACVSLGGRTLIAIQGDSAEWVVEELRFALGVLVRQLSGFEGNVDEMADCGAWPRRPNIPPNDINLN